MLDLPVESPDERPVVFTMLFTWHIRVAWNRLLNHPMYSVFHAVRRADRPLEQPSGSPIERNHGERPRAQYIQHIYPYVRYGSYIARKAYKG